MPDWRASMRRLWREALQHEILIEARVEMVQTMLGDLLRTEPPLDLEPEQDDWRETILDLVAQVPFLQARIKELEAELDSYRPGQRYRPRSVSPPAEVWDGRDPEPPEE